MLNDRAQERAGAVPNRCSSMASTLVAWAAACSSSETSYRHSEFLPALTTISWVASGPACRVSGVPGRGTSSEEVVRWHTSPWALG